MTEHWHGGRGVFVVEAGATIEIVHCRKIGGLGFALTTTIDAQDREAFRDRRNSRQRLGHAVSLRAWFRRIRKQIDREGITHQPTARTQS